MRNLRSRPHLVAAETARREADADNDDRKEEDDLAIDAASDAST
jgi:hypothetical protein